MNRMNKTRNQTTKTIIKKKHFSIIKIRDLNKIQTCFFSHIQMTLHHYFASTNIMECRFKSYSTQHSNDAKWFFVCYY